MLRFVCIYIFTGEPGTAPYIEDLEFLDASCSTLVQARDLVMKRERANYFKEFGDQRYSGCYVSVSNTFRKFSSRKLVGFHAFEDGMTFLFEEGHPVYKLIVSGTYSNNSVAQQLLDLWRVHNQKIG